MGALLQSLFILVWVVGVLAWVSIVVFGLKALRSIRRDVPIPRFARWNKANIVVFNPDCLTAEGRVHRRCAGWSVVAFGLLVLAGFVLSLGI
jgi:hypothetical protein